MISVSQAVEAIILHTPFLEEALRQNILNLSSVARDIKKDIETFTQKPVKTGAIVMALKRYNARGGRTLTGTVYSKIRDITVRSGLVGYTFRNSQTIASCQNELFQQIGTQPDIVCNISIGLLETTMIISASLEQTVRRVFADETEVAHIPSLAAIILRLTQDTTEIPGIYYMILKYLAWDGINVVEVVSTYTELTVIVREKDIDAAFSSIKQRLAA